MALFMFFLGIVLVVIGSDAFVEAAIRTAKRFHVSEMLIGATLVSIGTTLPELMVSTTAAFEGHLDMAVGNAIGSVICNTALIAGLVQAIRPTEIEPLSFRKNYTRFFAAAAVFCLFVYTGGGLSRIAGVCLLAVLLIHLADSYSQARNDRNSGPREKVKGSFITDLLVMVIMAAALFFGANLLVDNGSLLAKAIGIPEHVISISMIALGTSLPELITALTALHKKHTALSLGNIIGANILNLLLVSGAAAVIQPMGMARSILQVDIPMMLFVSLMLALPGLLRKKLYRRQGILLMLVYCLYIVYLYIFR